MAERLTLRKNDLTDPVTRDWVLNNKEALARQRSAFRMSQAPGAPCVKAGSPDMPLSILGIKSTRGAAGCRVKWGETKLWRWTGPEEDGPVKELRLCPPGPCLLFLYLGHRLLRGEPLATWRGMVKTVQEMIGLLDLTRPSPSSST